MIIVQIGGLHSGHYMHQSAVLVDAIGKTLGAVPGLTPANGIVVQTSRDHSARKIPCLSAFAVCPPQLGAPGVKDLMSLVAELLCVQLADFAGNYPARFRYRPYDTVSAIAMCGSACGSMDWRHPDIAEERELGRMLNALGLYCKHLSAQVSEAMCVSDEAALEQLDIARQLADRLYRELEMLDVLEEMEAGRTEPEFGP